MSICGKRAFTLLEKLSFERLSGSPEEERAADILMREVEELGLQGVKEAFEVTNSAIHTATLKVIAPYEKEYQVNGVARSGCTPPGGLTADVVYVGEATDVDLLDTTGKIVMVNRRPGVETYERIVKSKVAGIVIMSGEVYDNTKDTDLQELRLFAGHLEHGRIPAVTIRTADAFAMLEQNAAKAHLKLSQDEIVQSSHNVICEITGEEYPEELIAFTAHYDSVRFSGGANDNGAGSVILMELARYFTEHRPRRTLQFIWCGSEESALLGSYDYVKRHEADMAHVILNINVDVAGGYIGRNHTTVTGTQAVADVIDFMCKEQGIAMNVRLGVSSSDSVPFAEKGIPGINFVREGAPIHNRYDQLRYISPDRLAELAEVVLLFCLRVVNAKVFPIKRELSEGVKKDLIKYLQNWRGAKMEIPEALK